MSFEEFDKYCDEREAVGDKTPVHEMFGQWLSNISGSTTIGGPVGEPPTVIAIPDE